MVKKLFLLVVMLILLASLITGCVDIVNNTLDETSWFLRSYGEQSNLKAIIEGTEITATFDGSTAEISGSAGCNSYFAEYEIDGNKLTVFDMAFTEMACQSPLGIMEQEQEFLSILANAHSFEADHTMLTIFCSGGRQLYFTTATR
jgi:heat shock protein HslJ